MTTHDERRKSDSSRRARATTSRVIVPLLLLLGFGAAQVARQYHQAGAQAPTSAQRIYAALVEWGADSSDLIPPVDQADIDRHLAQLRSRNGEDRVRAARWLAARGVRDAGDEIAASMLDPGTLRPCQLAHSLGHLGDERWVGELVAAANQTGNTDLRVCATMGLRSLASDQACEAIIDLARSGEAPGAAIEALGIIGDAAPCREVQELIAARLERVQRDLTHLNEVKQLLQRWMGFCRTAERTGRCGVHDRLDAPGKASLQDLTISLDPESRFKVHNEQWTCWSLLQSSHLPLVPGSRAL